MINLRKAAEQALEAFEKIYEGCGEVKKDDLNKHSNGLAILVRKDCLPQIEALRQALAQPDEVLAEREACAKVVEEWLHGDWHNQGVVAAAMIRARGDKSK